MKQQVLQDLHVYHQLYRPGKKATLWSRLLLALTSRGFMQLATHRYSLFLQWHRAQPNGDSLRWRLQVLLFAPFELMMKAVSKSEILEQTGLDGGIYLSNRGGIMLGAQNIGRGSVIHDRVTIGTNVVTGGIPDIGENVWVGPGSIVYGGIKIGAGVTVLPGSVLTKNLPPRVVVQGNPARIVRKDFDNAPLRASLETDVIERVLGSASAGPADV
jgi:serine acetyltransferase